MPTTAERPQRLTAAERTACARAALHRANHVRLAQSKTKRWLFEAPDQAVSRVRCADLLLDPPPHVATMRIFDLLCACRQIGRHGAVKLLRRHQIGERRAIGQLTFRQCCALAGDLRDGYDDQLELISA